METDKTQSIQQDDLINRSGLEQYTVSGEFSGDLVNKVFNNLSRAQQRRPELGVAPDGTPYTEAMSQSTLELSYFSLQAIFDNLGSIEYMHRVGRKSRVLIRKVIGEWLESKTNPELSDD